MGKKRQILKLIASAVIIVLAVIALGGFISGHDVMYYLRDRSAIGPLTRADIEYLDIDAPAATSKDGTVSAKDWEPIYPEIVKTMWANAENSYTVDYLDTDTYLKNIYEGYGFALEYNEARGHEYTLEDIYNIARPHPKANCLTCKTPNFAKLVNDMGVQVYKMDFQEVYDMMEENISCYTCHGNDAGYGGDFRVTHSYVKKALGDNIGEIDPSVLSCGQCHIEYYFTREDNETMMPYHSVAEMTPEAILKYYDDMEFYDWINEATGAKMLKTQHPELETFLQGKHAKLLKCADCHMPMEQSEDGKVYHSHTLVSPLKNEMLLSTCAKCHEDTDMVTMVTRLQGRVTARENEVGNKLSKFKNTLAAANASGQYTEEYLDAVRTLYREAQWFFDFCYVENSEGAHNSELAFHCLDTSEIKIEQGMALLSRTQ